VELVDCCANLAHPDFAADLDQVLERASKVLKHLICTGSQVKDSKTAIHLARENPGFIYATAGIHPHEARNAAGQFGELAELARQTPMVRAIGEAGLDFHRNLASPVEQQQALEFQLELACELGLPVFLHERDAHQRMLEILRHHRDRLGRAVLHCFTGDRQALFRYLDLDLYIGLTGWICDERRGRHLLPLCGSIPSERLLLETDAPYLKPRDLGPDYRLARRHRNEPHVLPHIAATVATHTQLPLEELARQTTANARRFFGLEEQP